MKVDFKDGKQFVKDFLKTHGYNDYFSDAKNGGHINLYNLINTFANNLSTETRKKIETKGIKPSIIGAHPGICRTSRQL